MYYIKPLSAARIMYYIKPLSAASILYYMNLKHQRICLKFSALDSSDSSTNKYAWNEWPSIAMHGMSDPILLCMEWAA